MAATGTARFTYVQVAESLKAELAVGEVPPGGRMPSIRALAQRFAVSAQTIQSALSVLEEEGLIRSASTRGYFVSDDVASAIEKPAAQDLAGELEAVRAELRRLTERVEQLEGAVRNGASRKSSPS